MQSTARDVTSYLQEVPPDPHEALSRLRKLCQDTLKGYEECMDYGEPCYKRDGQIEVGFASQKNYISLYILKEDVLAVNKDLLKGLNTGKGCIRYTRPDKIDFGVVKKLLAATRKSRSPICQTPL